jgi:hypothetical protein
MSIVRAVVQATKEILEMTYKPLALAAAALVAGVLGFGNAEAANVMTGSGPSAQIPWIPNANIQQVGHHHNHWHGNGWGGFGSGLFLGFGLGSIYRPYGYGYPGYGYGYPGYGYGYPGYGYGYPGYGYGYGYRPYYRTYYGGGSAHVRWCYNHYRTYSARSNTFIGYDGYRHRCRSPYRY